MRIILVGAGVVGFHLAERLSVEGHDISVIDSNPELVRRIDEKMDVLAIAGDAATPSVLRRAEVENADLVIAVTDRDTTNLVVSLVARRMGAKKRIVRVRNAEFSSNNTVLSHEDLGADFIINPVETTANLLERLIRNPGATDVAEFADGDLLLWGFRVPAGSALVGVQLKDLREQYSGSIRALIVAITRPDGSMVIPRGEDAILEGDIIYVFIHRKATGEFRRLVQPEEKRVERLVISGATPLGIKVARRLEGRVKKCVLVDASRERAEKASEALGKTLVLCGDIVDSDFSREYDLGNTDYFLALTDDDQTNLMNSLLLKKQGARRIAVQAQRPQFLPVLQSLGIGVIVTPRLLTVNAILRHIRRGRILHVSQIGESGAEAREYEATRASPVVGKPIREVKVPQGAIIGAIFRREAFMIPDGDSEVKVGDHVVIFALPEAMEGIERLFARRKAKSRDR
ncbi:MAG: Trk system potassium transporter TrkA [Planctomycetota bacterium]